MIGGYPNAAEDPGPVLLLAAAALLRAAAVAPKFGQVDMRFAEGRLVSWETHPRFDWRDYAVEGRRLEVVS